jgi:hypothetical protein
MPFEVSHSSGTVTQVKDDPLGDKGGNGASLPLSCPQMESGAVLSVSALNRVFQAQWPCWVLAWTPTAHSKARPPLLARPREPALR